MEQKLLINTEEQLLNLIERLRNEENIPFDSLDLSAFCQVQFKINGDKYHGELTSSLCYSLNNYHENLLRLYCLAKYGEENLSRLKESEKPLLEITFHIKEGCTEWDVNLQEVIEHLAETLTNNLIEKMTPGQLTTCVILIILCFTGYKVYDRFAKSKDSANERNAINEALSIQSQAMNSLANTLVERTETLAEEHIKTYDNPQEIKISVASTETILDSEDIQEINRRSRRKLQNQDDTKELEIEAIKKSSWDKLTVTCRLANQDHSFPLYVDTSFIDKEETDLLFDAFKEGKTVFVLADYKSYQGKIEKANASSIYTERPKQS